MTLSITEHVVKTARHTTFYLACGAEDAPLIVFVHGWPELSISWRHQLPSLASLGFRTVAPDMRGYGRSSVYPRHEDYALEHAIADMIELLDALGREKAVWVGHDWGSPVVWSLASHHPERCFGVANLCVPYFAKGFAPETFLPHLSLAYVERPVEAGPVRTIVAPLRDTAFGSFLVDEVVRVRVPAAKATILEPWTVAERLSLRR